MIAIGYIRRSKKAEDNTVSLLEQERQIRLYCESKGMVLGAIVTHNGVSGAKRERWTEIRSMVEQHQARAVVTYNQDRLSRDGAGLLDNIRRLAAIGVEVHEVGVGHMNIRKPISKLTIAMRGAMDEFYRDVIREKTADALRYRKDQSQRYTRQPPFGFAFEAGRMVSDPEESRALGIIKSGALAGLGARKVIRRLQSSGYEGRQSVFVIHQLVKKFQTERTQTVQHGESKEEIDQSGPELVQKQPE